MARIVTNHDASGLPPRLRYYAYNCLDTCLTFGVHNALIDELDEETGRIYAFERGMQNVAMTLQVRGIAIDEKACWAAVQEIERDEKKVEGVLNRLAEVWWGKGLNPRSPTQLKTFLYEVLGLPVQHDKKGTVTTGNDAIEALIKKDKRFYTLFRCLQKARELRKQLGFLKAPRSPDGRIRASFNVGATETGRWSSSKNCFNEGLNYQNVYKKLRYIFIPTKGRKMCNADLEQAESCLVAHLSGDREYIRAHQSFNTHTYVAKMIWPDEPWPNDEGEKDVKFAKQKNFIRRFSRYDLSKRFQHGTNYGGTEYVMAIILHILRSDAKDIIDRYFSAFPGVKLWQNWRKHELVKTGVVTTFLGRRRQFFDRLWENSTQREAIAYEPQSGVGDILNVGLYRVWKHMDGKDLWLLHQGHDSILFEFDPEHEEEVKAQVCELMRVEVEINGEPVVIPVDAQVGENWLEACA